MAATQAMLTSIATERAHLVALRDQLVAGGDRQLAQAVERARRELMTPAVTGAENTFGVNSSAVRR